MVQRPRGQRPAWFNRPVTGPGRLTTHVLDVARGRPAEGVEIALYGLGDDGRKRLAGARTNADGRTDAPLVAAGDLRAQAYELEFAVGAYLAREHAAAGFLDTVPVRFTVTDAAADHHVPLLLTPWSYSTYRGS